MCEGPPSPGKGKIISSNLVILSIEVDLIRNARIVVVQTADTVLEFSVRPTADFANMTREGALILKSTGQSAAAQQGKLSTRHCNKYPMTAEDAWRSGGGVAGSKSTSCQPN